jgi:hypothetical protein
LNAEKRSTLHIVFRPIARLHIAFLRTLWSSVTRMALKQVIRVMRVRSAQVSAEKLAQTLMTAPAGAHRSPCAAMAAVPAVLWTVLNKLWRSENVSVLLLCDYREV